MPNKNKKEKVSRGGSGEAEPRGEAVGCRPRGEEGPGVGGGSGERRPFPGAGRAARGAAPAEGWLPPSLLCAGLRLPPAAGEGAAPGVA